MTALIYSADDSLHAQSRETILVSPACYGRRSIEVFLWSVRKSAARSVASLLQPANGLGLFFVHAGHVRLVCLTIKLQTNILRNPQHTYSTQGHPSGGWTGVRRTRMTERVCVKPMMCDASHKH